MMTAVAVQSRRGDSRRDRDGAQPCHEVFDTAVPADEAGVRKPVGRGRSLRVFAPLRSQRLTADCCAVDGGDAAVENAPATALYMPPPARHRPCADPGKSLGACCQRKPPKENPPRRATNSLVIVVSPDPFRFAVLPSNGDDNPNIGRNHRHHRTSLQQVESRAGLVCAAIAGSFGGV